MRRKYWRGYVRGDNLRMVIECFGFGFGFGFGYYFRSFILPLHIHYHIHIMITYSVISAFIISHSVQSGCHNSCGEPSLRRPLGKSIFSFISHG